MRKNALLIFILISNFLFSVDIKSVSGKVFFTKSGSPNKIVKKEMKFGAGDTIITSAKSQIVLLFKDGSVVTVSENSRYLISSEGSPQSKDSTKTILVNGKASFNLEKLKKNYDTSDESYKMYTPTSVVGVRGTTFDVVSDNNGRSQVAVTKGKVAASANPVNDSDRVTEGELIESGTGFSSDKNNSFKKQSSNPKSLAVPPVGGALESEYVLYHHQNMKTLFQQIETNYSQWKSTLAQKEVLEQKAKLALDAKKETEGKELLKTAYETSISSFLYKKKMAHKILQYFSYEMLLEKSTIVDPEIVQIKSRIELIAKEIKLK